jgi:signal peptidase I
MGTRALQFVGGLALFVVGASVMFRVAGHIALQTYRIPSSAMEPTLHCARPSPGCEADTMDRVFVPRIHPSWTPGRGDIVAFETPPAARARCGSGGRPLG